MPNGRPGDSPLTDILSHGLTVYGSETDGLIREIRNLSSMQETYDWWSQEFYKHEGDPVRRYQIAIDRVNELRKRTES